MMIGGFASRSTLMSPVKRCRLLCVSPTFVSVNIQADLMYRVPPVNPLQDAKLPLRIQALAHAAVQTPSWFPDNQFVL